MSFKTILTILTNPADAARTITAAAAFARGQDAHLDILVLGVDRIQMGYSYVGMGPVLSRLDMDRTEDEARKTEAAVRAALAQEGPDLRYSVEAVVTQIGAIVDFIGIRARFADLVVLPRPYGTGIGSEAEAIVEAALFEGRAPVLVLPQNGLSGGTMPKRIVLAWNQSAEAMTAARRALPMLKQAAAVSITVVDPPSHGAERSDPGGLLCQMLVRHGVKAEVSVLARTLPRVSDVLMRHATDINADMLVMGAYGHSRFREAILGGATRNMLENATIPVLMAH